MVFGIIERHEEASKSRARPGRATFRIRLPAIAIVADLPRHCVAGLD